MGKAADSLKGFVKAAQGVSRELDDVGKKMSLAITAPLALLAKASLDQAKEAREAIGQVEAAITSSGDSVGRTVPQLQAMAKALQNISVFDDDDILKNVTANLVTFGNIQGPIFDRAQKAVVNLASRMGGDLAGASIKVGRALNDPIQGTQALTRMGIQFTTAEKAQIKALVDAGKGQEAQGLILDKLAAKFDGAALALRKASPDAQLAQAWRDFQETIGHIEVQLLPALTTQLKKIFDGFQALSPEMQKFLVVSGAILAVVGPTLVVLGGMVRAISAIVPVVKGLWVALAPFAVELLAIAAAVGVLAAAIYASQQVTKDGADAISTAKDELTKYDDIMQKAMASSKGMTAEDRDAAAQKLKLAENTLKAAIAQTQLNLSQNQQKMSGGVFSGAWEDVKSMAHGELPPELQMVQEKNTLKALGAALDDVHGKQTDLFNDAAKPHDVKLNFDPHNEADIAKAKEALKSLDQELTAMSINLKQGLDELALPKATAAANAMNARLDDYVKRAKDAGANTAAFADRIAALRARIAELQAQGIAKEATAFGQQVDKDAQAVDKFAKGGLPPLAEKLRDVDDQYQTLRDSITDEIAKNAALADSNDDARKAMERLQAILASLEDSHKKATTAAIAQAAAEQKLADLQTQANNLQTSQQIRDMRDSLSGKGPISSQQSDLQSSSDQLAEQQIKTQQDLIKLEQERDALVAQNVKGENDKQIENLNSEIDLQTKLYDLVSSTTATQLLAAKQVDEAFKSFTDNLKDSLSDMIANWSFDLKGLMNIFRQLAEQLFIKPVIGNLTDQFGGFLKGMFNDFAGGHADGGKIPSGKWGIVGERGPEFAFGGASGMDVAATGTVPGRGVTQVFNISTPDPGAFRRSQRQIQKRAKQGLGQI